MPSLHWYLSKIPGASRTFVLPLRQFEWSAQFYKVAREVFRSDPVDIVEITEQGSLFLARGALGSSVIRLHGSDYMFRKHTGDVLHSAARWNHRLELAALRRARAVTSPSAYQASQVGDELGWPEQRIHVIPNPIASDMLVEALRARAPLDQGVQSQIVLYTGRLAQVKGTRRLLDAMQDVYRTYPSASLILAGPWQLPEAPDRLGLQEQSRAGGQRTVWMGHVPWRNLMDVYRRASVFVMPSYYESFGISCLEAMACGLPVVATTAGGLPEVVEDGVTGILVPPGDSTALAEAINLLLSDAELRQRLGHAGRERVLATFTPDRVAEQTLSAYRSIIGMS
ncbi:MAG: glycosyltransferase family 4 protein [Kouleothrix sp.]|nr:glycosyltransferase family 4 protein [Kouleothrix sp.]